MRVLQKDGGQAIARASPVALSSQLPGSMSRKTKEDRSGNAGE